MAGRQKLLQSRRLPYNARVAQLFTSNQKRKDIISAPSRAANPGRKRYKMTHAELETRIGETKTLREWIAELDLRPTTLNAETTDETYAYVVCTEDRTYHEYIVVSDYRGRSLTAESEEMYLDAEFELDGMGGYSLEETAASFSARHEKARALRKAIIRAKFELARLAGMSDAVDSSIDEVCRRMPEIADRLYIDGEVL
nr:MAG TPA: hypothetical protein [Caudoviricetes sp.]